MLQPTAPAYYDRRVHGYERWSTPDVLLAELGGGTVLHAGPWFVVVRAAR